MNINQLKILLADDDDDDCIFFKDALVELHLANNLTSVHNGEQLMELLSNETLALPDVLFLDINMPRKNGFECLTEIKASSRLMPLLVIIFSTSYEQGVVNMLYKNGAQYFIRKPVIFAQFKKIVQQAIMLIAKNDSEQPTRNEFVLTLKNISTEY